MYSILFVCTGNICRSPTAEQVTRVLLERRGLAGVVEVDSAGLYDGHVGEAPDVRARAIAGSHGYDLSGLRAKGFEDEDFRSEEHTSALQSLMRISYAALCFEKKKDTPVDTEACHQ